MVRIIDRESLKKKLENGDKFVLVEVLNPDEYKRAHIKGAINIPVEEIAGRAKQQFSPDQEIVVYCASFQCKASIKAAEKLSEMGFSNVLAYEGGKRDWKEAGYPMENGEPAK